MGKVLGGFGLLTGATYPLRALMLFQRTPRLWGYMVIPILVNLIVGIALYAGLLLPGWQGVENLTVHLNNWFDRLIADLPAWLNYLEFLIIGLGFLLRFLLIVGLLLVIGFLLLQFGTLLGAPWYGQLSEKLEELRTGEVQIVEVGLVQDIGRAILFEVKKLLLLLGVGIPLLLLNWLPGIGTFVATVGGIIITATITCLDFFDGPLERRRLRFRKKLKIVLGAFPASASFSLVCLGLMSVPVLNLLIIPLCVASGTLFVCDRVLPKLSKKARRHEAGGKG
ncbi:MAG: hypothetical protein F6J86_29780 [Symploca sp. SIO1B1]|nr:hypothetical protein [Symploca sp. SIO1B1]